MSREVQERIFEPFFTTKSATQGTGLGLAVVRGIMKGHDGAITVYSEPDRGTQFHLYFPAVDAPTSDAGKASGATSLGRGERILYLDDEPALVALAIRHLTRLGYRTDGFTQPAEALTAFARAPNDYDLVVTDMSMPGTTGIDFSRQILALRSDIPIILASGYVRPDEVERALAVGIRKVIWKPATIGEMAEILAAELANGRDG
jgi:CheY-like chemotaxis protein